MVPAGGRWQQVLREQHTSARPLVGPRPSASTAPPLASPQLLIISNAACALSSDMTCDQSALCITKRGVLQD